MLSSFVLATANYTDVTATITDSTGQAWIGGMYRVDFVALHTEMNYTLAGATFTQHYGYATLNSSGALAISLPDNHIITPPGSKWKFTICPNATAPCSTATVDVHGTTQSLTTALSAAVAAPVVNAQPVVAKAYKATEVKVSGYAPNSQASLFYDTTVNCLKVYSGSSWACISGTSGMTWPAAAGIAVCTGTPCTAWTTSIVAPSGALVGTSDTQALTNKTLTTPSMTPQSIDCHTACSPTASQLSNAIVWNYGQGASNVQITGPTVAAGMNFIMVVGTAQAANYWRYSSTTADIYLDGSSTAVTNIIFAAPVVGDSFSCFSFQTGASTYSLKCTTLAGTSTSS